MNRIQLTEAYIAKKVAMGNQELSFARETMAKDEYHAFVMNKNIEEFDEELFNKAKAVIINRFGLRSRPRLFRTPTLRLWVAEVLNAYSREDILNFFSERSGFAAEKIARETIDSNLLYGDFLSNLVDELEFATGKQLCDSNDMDHPLWYLYDDITYGDIADFFSENGSKRVEENKALAGVC